MALLRTRQARLHPKQCKVFSQVLLYKIHTKQFLKDHLKKKKLKFLFENFIWHIFNILTFVSRIFSEDQKITLNHLAAASTRAFSSGEDA